MELIKKIKQAEKQAQEVVEHAKVQTAAESEKNRSLLAQALAKADQERKQAIQTAVTAAESQGLAEIEELKAKAETGRQQLREAVGGKMAAAVTKIMDHLKG